MAAPAAIASRITSGFCVSTDTGTPQSASRSSTGSTRRRSSSSVTPQRPGARRFAADVDDVGAFVDQLPRVRDGLRRSRNLPPSENESGVTLTTPMISGRDERQPEFTAVEE